MPSAIFVLSRISNHLITWLHLHHLFGLYPLEIGSKIQETKQRKQPGRKPPATTDNRHSPDESQKLSVECFANWRRVCETSTIALRHRCGLLWATSECPAAAFSVGFAFPLPFQTSPNTMGRPQDQGGRLTDLVELLRDYHRCHGVALLLYCAATDFLEKL